MKCTVLVFLCAVIIAAESKAFNSGCPNGLYQVYCFIDPCMLDGKCQNHPEAKCISDYCGGCNKKWEMPDGSYLNAFESSGCNGGPILAS